MRGTRRGVRPRRHQRGIIPACAGNTSKVDFKRLLARDHPRVCGEHAVSAGTKVLDAGSSPRVRGTQRPRHPLAFATGIIPACAGNTIAPSRGSARLWDHPRVCGEHRRQKHDAAANLGSSPRVRGTPDTVHEDVNELGIIPACAGNTLENPSSKSRKRKNKLHFNQFAEEMQRCLTVRFCAMGSFVVKVQQVKHGFQMIVWRLW